MASLAEANKRFVRLWLQRLEAGVVRDDILQLRSALLCVEVDSDEYKVFEMTIKALESLPYGQVIQKMKAQSPDAWLAELKKRVDDARRG